MVILMLVTIRQKHYKPLARILWCEALTPNIDRFQ